MRSNLIQRGMARRVVWPAMVLLLGLAGAAGCSGRQPAAGPAAGPAGGATGGAARAGAGGAGVVRVPQDTRSLQKAMNRVRPGGLVLVSPGVYRESVTIAKPRVVLRGTDRSGVVVDGEFRRPNGVTVTGAGSVVENLTVRNHLADGVLFTGVTDARLQAGRAGGSAHDLQDTEKFPPLQGFRASYVTAYDNALHGIYVSDAQAGVIDHSYASGQAGSGIYVGRCQPCWTVVRDNVTEHNAVGIEVTNASEQLWLLGNRASRNRIGLTVNSNDVGTLGPQHGAVVAGNAFTDNNDADSPNQADVGFGIGIGTGGGRDNLFQQNLVSGNRAAGIAISDVQGYPATGNVVRDNSVTLNGTDLVLSAADRTGNRLSGNGRAVVARRLTAVPEPPGVSFQNVPAPPAQQPMPQAATQPPQPAVGLPGTVEAQSYRIPRSG
ncbi:nitrous oxide reductase family maturation protein NosD [Streptomyces sp. CoH27]|uniref:right-handed parallel beta-helix repeat-containing protein n=1 Tax=Streptomyces sp. CoH27 TaxID=2875763 RepID=UPI001CD6E8CF|nr:right-handed parallel beta-helix repeat-containing protein [Streptomyces sp. CoH27]